MSDKPVIPVVVGVDVGGTNTDAVVITQDVDKPMVIAGVKELTTSDVTTGVQRAVKQVLNEACRSGTSVGVVQVNIGTTHFINAAVQGKDLAKVSVIRLCGSVSEALPPFSDFPKHFKDIICHTTHLVAGGYRFDGRAIDDVNRAEIEEIVKASGAIGFVVCGVFSPIRYDQEREVESIIREVSPDASVSLSHDIGHIGLLERENAAILNECLKPLCQRTIDGFRDALGSIGLDCPIYLTQNDGTIISSDKARKYPVYTFASGPTNSMRGAAFLSSIKDAIVVDIGGTTTDVGVLKNGFPREASSHVKIGGVRTNFRMPDVLSIGLGGGSYVIPRSNESDGITSITVGPLSAGFNLKNEALVFSNEFGEEGRSLTTTDIAVAAGLVELGNKDFVRGISETAVTMALDRVQDMIAAAIDKVKLSDQSLPVILVGGGSILVDLKRSLPGATEVLLPKHFGVANAIGAALSQVSGSIDHIVSILDMIDREAMDKCVVNALAKVTEDPDGKESEMAEELARKPFISKARDQALASAIERATAVAVEAGANPSTVQVTEKQDMTLSYMPGQATRLKIKVVGDLSDHVQRNIKIVKWLACEDEDLGSVSLETMHSKQEVSAGGTKLSGQDEVNDATKVPMDPTTDPETGMWSLSEWDIECIVVGAGIFGCGGGGNPHMGRLRALETLRSGKEIKVITPERLLKNADPENDLVSIVCFYGAPLIMYEQLVSSKETTAAIRCVEDIFNIGQFQNGTLNNKSGVTIEERAGMRFINDYKQTGNHNSSSPSIKGKQIKALMAVEIGGMNAIEPYLVAADLNLPVVDADAMGRAFPKLSMMCPYMYGLPAYPTALVDDKNRQAVMLEAPNATLVEHHFRDVVTEMGCSAGCSFSPLVKEDVLTKCVQHTISRAWRLGDAILRSRIEKTSPIEAILKTETSIHVMIGKIRDVKRETSGGYNKGHVIIEGLDTYSGQRLLINFQNENLVIIPLNENNDEGDVIACVPDLIAIVDADTAEPITTEEVRYGMRVSVIVIASPDILRTDTALKYVGPQAFQYPDTVKFQPFGQSKVTVPIPPTE
ncbi:uncharacterized protein LOC124292189 [Haliotis rubra]|uniref:uncharacterized protein LOC124292189 n=1 Tax=Haliotis rubra TaxID=36100 RepID=UPI001EE60ED8|nr:uncharacterized protein LOC124292189 [Haliotis rubra]